jgi:histone deacetylase 6
MATYLWTNYIEPHGATQVFLMGVGDAYLGLVDLIGRNESTTEEGSKIDMLIGFLAASTIQSVRRPTEDDVATWYYQVFAILLATQARTDSFVF